MIKYLFILLLLVSSSYAIGNMDYPVNIPTGGDTLTYGVALIQEGSNFYKRDLNGNIVDNSLSRSIHLHTDWDTRQGVQAEIRGTKASVTVAYYDNKISSTIQRYKNGSTKEDFFRKEDFAKFVYVGVGGEDFDVYFQRECSRYGSYKIGDQESKPFTLSGMKLGVKAYEKTRFGSLGMFLEGTREKNFRVLRIGQTKDDGTLEVKQMYGPFNNTVNGVMGGMFKAPDPTGKLYLTTAGSAGVGVKESPVNGLNLGMPGYHYYDEGYDIATSFSASAIVGLNMQFGFLKARISAEVFGKMAFDFPVSNVYADGVNPDNIPEGETQDDIDGMFTEEYVFADILYGASVQAKVLF